MKFWISAHVILATSISMVASAGSEPNFGLEIKVPSENIREQGWSMVIGVLCPQKNWTPEYWELSIGNSELHPCGSSAKVIYRVTKKWISIDSLNFGKCIQKKTNPDECNKYLSPTEDTVYNFDSLQIEADGRYKKFISLIDSIKNGKNIRPVIDGWEVKVFFSKMEIGKKIVSSKNYTIDSPSIYDPSMILKNEIWKKYHEGNRCDE